jgi:plasmid stabilization system protein ParE
MMQIVFSPEALKDIEEIKSYLLGQFGEETSSKNIKKIIKEIRTLSSFQLKGTGIWERYGIDSEYRYIYSNKNYVFYRIEDDVKRIIRVLDARRDFLNILFGIKPPTEDIDEKDK